MSKTLNLVDCLLTSARHLHRAGRSSQALEILERLVRFRVLPAAAAEEVHSLLAELHLDQTHYLKARRHLTAALAVQPENAAYHFRLAQAIEADPAARPERARSHYLKALQIEPKNAAYWLEYAVYLLTLGYTPRGLKALRRAHVLGDHDPEIVGRVAETLRQEGLVDEARTKLVAALFNHPRDRRFRALWQEHQFVMLYDQQQNERQPEIARRPTRPTLLPFVARETTGRFTRLGERTLRMDPPRRLKGPTSMQRQPRRRPQ